MVVSKIPVPILKFNLEKLLKNPSDEAYNRYIKLFEDTINNKSYFKNKGINYWLNQHSIEVGIYSKILAEHIKNNKDEPQYYKEHINLDTDTLFCAGLLHDIGKYYTGCPELLEKKGITEEERKKIKEHPVLGALFLDECFTIDGQKDEEVMKNTVKMHHGLIGGGNSYPFGFNTKEIPKYVQIIALTDFLDSKTKKRPYRDQILSEEEAKLEAFNNGFHKIFDKTIFNYFMNISFTESVVRCEIAKSAIHNKPTKLNYYGAQLKHFYTIRRSPTPNMG